MARGKWVLGRVHPEATLNATGASGSVVRDGENFAVPMEAGLAAGQPAWTALGITASREGVGKNGGNVQQTQTGSLWFAASPESLTYDEDGNLQTDGRWLYLWDAENRLKAMETQASAIAAGVPAMRLEFAYDAMGRRVQKVVKSFSSSSWVVTSDLRYLYDGWNLIAEFEKHSPSLPISQSPRLVRAYAWGRDLSGTQQGAGGVGGLVLTQQLSTTVNNGQPRSTSLAPAYDGNGNITAYLDLANGRITARLDYDAFGKPVWSELSSTVGAGERIPFGFSTKYEDRETGLLYYGYRYYAPEMGRWLNRDPIEEQVGINLYGMCGNEMTNRVDVYGFYSPIVIGHLSSAYSVVARSKLAESMKWHGAINTLINVASNSNEELSSATASGSATYGILTNTFYGVAAYTEETAIHEATHAFNDQVNPGIQGLVGDEGMAYAMQYLWRSARDLVTRHEPAFRRMENNCELAATDAPSEWNRMWQMIVSRNGASVASIYTFELGDGDFSRVASALGVKLSCKKIAEVLNKKFAGCCINFACKTREEDRSDTYDRGRLGRIYLEQSLPERFK